ncbi:uncharacterized protein A1O5_10124 [Cladophialophora psammophila CBS 110553]|uniref:Uncharacterized protein n=1 Tax=Cladophialophora psammophila CBS 110553 TaxID=1182543 RepID=W9X916_9EURO|nr:uncharacterized protein A1O5_10124 [Cladophialophora psammophila CBS 110553]EXJ66929.1 hypothetical protein A1O5_10124 [Cladophialophora psammophila CBS 110553]
MGANGDTAGSSAPVAYITGGASGMGLAVARELAAKGWNLTIVDLNEKSISSVESDFDPKRTMFVQADVTDYESQAKAFAQTWDKWHRLDLVFANAGIGDRISFYAPATEFLPNLPGVPAKPDELVIDVCLNAMVYSAYLAMHFFRQNPSKAGKIVFTSSMCGLYPGDTIPLYTAAKHGIVGLVRAMARRLTTLGEPITVNCICPGLVDTGLTGVLMSVAPPEYVTPKSTIVRAVMGFVEDDSLTGQAAECSIDKIHYRKQPEWGDEGAEYIMTNKLEAELKRRGVNFDKKD